MEKQKEAQETEKTEFGKFLEENWIILVLAGLTILFLLSLFVFGKPTSGGWFY